MKTIYTKLGYPIPGMSKKEKFFFWVLMGLFTLSMVAIATAYVFSVVGNASGENIPFI